MKQFTTFAYLLILCLYPLLSYLIRTGIGINPNYFLGFIGLPLLVYRLFDIYGSGTKLRVPFYLVFLGMFAAYTVFSGIFLSEEFAEEGPVKFFYTNMFIQSFIAFLLLENTYFPPKWIKLATKILGVMLVIALGVAIIQIRDPLFFLNTFGLKEGLAISQMEQYYNMNPEEATNYASLVMAGYRFSIYSWIDRVSVGIDSLTVFSLLLAGTTIGKVKKGGLTIVAGLIAFLSSARWIMLNFLIIAAQNLLIQKNKVLRGIKYLFVGLILILALGVLASSLGIDMERFISDRLFAKSAGTRLYAFEVFFKLFPENPIFGTGGEESANLLRLISGRTSQIHVGYLNLFYIYGLVGGIIYLTFLGTFLYRFWKSAVESKYWGSFFAVLGFAIANLTLVRLDPFFYSFFLALIFSNHYAGEHQVLDQDNALIEKKGKKADQSLLIPQASPAD